MMWVRFSDTCICCAFYLLLLLFFLSGLLASFSRSGRNNFNMMSNDFNSSNYNLYGLSASFLESLGISGPLHNKVFVANVSICIIIIINYEPNQEKQKTIPILLPLPKPITIIYIRISSI